MSFRGRLARKALGFRNVRFQCRSQRAGPLTCAKWWIADSIYDFAVRAKAPAADVDRTSECGFGSEKWKSTAPAAKFRFKIAQLPSHTAVPRRVLCGRFMDGLTVVNQVSD